MWVESRTRIHPQYWVGFGLLARGRRGHGGLARVRAHFSRRCRGICTLPLIGELHVSSALLFDIGVYLLVIGATVLMLVALAHQSLRSHRRPIAVAEATEVRVDTAVTTTPEGGELMEIVYALAIGVLTGSGVWLLLRPRTFQVIMGLALLSYAINLFIFAHGTAGRRSCHRSSIRATASDPALYADPGAAGVGADGHRDQLCDDGAVPGRAAGSARTDRNRSRRRPGA